VIESEPRTEGFKLQCPPLEWPARRNANHLAIWVLPFHVNARQRAGVPRIPIGYCQGRNAKVTPPRVHLTCRKLTNAAVLASGKVGYGMARYGKGLRPIAGSQPFLLAGILALMFGIYTIIETIDILRSIGGVRS